MADLTLKQHDTRPILEIQLVEGDPANPDPIDLTTATSVKFLMDSTAPVLEISRAGAFVDRANGWISVTFQAGDVAVSGEFRAEAEITWADGGIQTVPNDSYLSIQILADVG